MKTKINGYAVVCDVAMVHGRKVKNYVSSVHPTRDEARQEKAFHGGKECGVRIVKLQGFEEVR